MLRIQPAVAFLIMLLGCATPKTQLAPVAREDVRAEEIAQRQLVLVELAKAQQRLNDLSFPLLRAATPLCAGKTGPRLGLSYRSLAEFQGPWVEAARSALNLTPDTLTITGVSAGSPAAVAGVAVGDRLLAVAGRPAPSGRGAAEAVSRMMREAGTSTVRLTVYRGSSTLDIDLVPEIICDLGMIVIVEGDINAYADGKNVILPWAMMRFANDDELRAVIAHEIAHNAMGHIEARRKNALWAGLLGALADVALTAQGVNTGGENTATFMRLGAMAFSQDFEREADYVGMYIMARAGVPLDAGPNLWRQFAQINPAAISYASTHPTTAERFVRLRLAIQEIEAKRAGGRELLPEMRIRN